MATPIEHAFRLASANGWEVVAFLPLRDANPKLRTFVVISNYRNEEEPERTFCSHLLYVFEGEEPACLRAGCYGLTLDEALAEAKEQN